MRQGWGRRIAASLCHAQYVAQGRLAARQRVRIMTVAHIRATHPYSHGDLWYTATNEWGAWSISINAAEEARHPPRLPPGKVAEWKGKGKGSHSSVFFHPQVCKNFSVAGSDGEDAKRYDEDNLREAVRLLDEARRRNRP